MSGLKQDPVVYVVDDDTAVCHGLSRLIESVNLTAKTFASAQDFLKDYNSDQRGCLVLDVRMPGMSGLKLQSILKEKDCSIPIIFISGHGDIPMAVRAFKQGALDFIEKPVGDQVLLDSIQEAIERDFYLNRKRKEQESIRTKLAKLTTREREVLELVIIGKTNKVIAAELNISHRTVEVHRHSIMEKTGVESTAQLGILVIKASGSILN